MEVQIKDLVKRYDSGAVSRRALVQALAGMVLARAIPAYSESSFKGNSLNHVTLRVADVRRSTGFYSNLLGLPIREQKEMGAILGLGRSFLALSNNPAAGETIGVHHFSIGIENFDVNQAAARLRQQGLEPEVASSLW